MAECTKLTDVMLELPEWFIDHVADDYKLAKVVFDAARAERDRRNEHAEGGKHDKG